MCVRVCVCKIVCDLVRSSPLCSASVVTCVQAQEFEVIVDLSESSLMKAQFQLGPRCLSLLCALQKAILKPSPKAVVRGLIWFHSV